jgi:probable rRNA maturation factor
MLAKAGHGPAGSKFISLNVDIDDDAWVFEEITKVDLRRGCVLAFNEAQHLSQVDSGGVTECEIAILLTTDAQSQSLNLQFRGVDKPTNVLSFSALNVDCPPLMLGQPLFIGDIAIAAETVIREAGEQSKTVSNHLLHMVIHGTLHLLGYDHEEENEALKMETLERKVLETLNISDPYVAMEKMS